MYFKVLTWESTGWEESSASSTKKLTRNSDKRRESQEQKLWLPDQSASWDLWFMDKLLNIILRVSLVEVSHSQKSERQDLPQISLNQLELPLITEDATKMLNIKMLMLLESTNTKPSSFFSQDMRVLPRRVSSMIQLLSNWSKSRTTRNAHIKVFSNYQRYPEDARPPLSPRTFSHSKPTTLSERPEPTRDMQASEPREQRKPKRRRSELNVDHSNLAHLYLQLIQFASLKSTKLYYAYDFVWS